MQYDQDPVGVLTPLPAQNIDTGSASTAWRCILQGTDIVFETDQFTPLIALGEELSGSATARVRRSTARCASSPTTRAA